MLTATPQTIAFSGSNYNKNRPLLQRVHGPINGSFCAEPLLQNHRLGAVFHGMLRPFQLAVALTLARLGGVNTKAYLLLYSPPI